MTIEPSLFPSALSGYTRRRVLAAWLAWALLALTVALALAGPVVIVRQAGSVGTLGASVVNGLAAIMFCLVGALIVSRQPRNTIGWLLVVVGVSFSFSTTVLDNWTQALPATAVLTPSTFLLLWVSSWSWWLLVGPLLLIPLLFPTGRLLSPRWRWAIGLLGLSFGAFLVGATFAANVTLPNATQPVPSPIGFLPDAVDQIFFAVFTWTLVVAALVCGAALLVRYRRAGALERQQIKWFLYAGALFVVAFILQFLLSSASPNNTIDLPGILFAFAILAVPLSIGIAILRYRLWDIDILIRRTLVYAVLTGLLALTYFGCVVVLQYLVGLLTGQAQSTLVTVVSTLLIAALFVPLRRRVQTAIDRRLYRRKYNAAHTLAAFSATLRDSVDLDALTVQLLDTVDETMQPATAELWLARNRRDR
jgi:hypothetical protein